jgi:PAS domain S-box-containing protein
VLRVATKEGEIRWFEDRGRPEWDDTHSRIVRIVGAARDITDRRQAEEALRRYEDIVSTVSDPISFVDTAYVYRAVNDTYAWYAKRTREEIVGLSVPELLGGETFAGQVKPHLDRCFAGEEVHYEAWFDVPGEPRRFMEVGYYPAFREDGKLTGAVVVSRDTTDRKRMQEDLRRESNLLSRIAATSPIGIVVFDLQGRIILANDLVQQMSGLASEELRQQQYNAPNWRLLREDGSPLPDEDLPFARVLKTAEPVRDVHLWCELPDGVGDSKSLAISANAAPLLDSSGNPDGVIVTVEDITARLAAEERLRLQTTALTSAANAIVITDRDGVILWANPAFTDLTGYRMEELLGQNPRLLKSGIQDREFYREMWATILSGRVWQGELVNRRKDGSLYTEEMSITPVQARHEAITHSVGIKQDVTDRKRAEEQAELGAAAAERERLARDLHDAVTQVLFSVAAIAEALPRVWARDPKEGQRGLEQLRTLTRAALAEMRSMLLELRPAALVERKLGDLLRQLTDGMLGRTQMPVTTTVDGDCDLPPEVQIAFYRIAQEALNNIVKYSRAKEASVSLLCEPGRTLLSIRDDGRGFDSRETLPHQLGLGIMRERALDIGAELVIRTKPGRGTEVVVEWCAVGGDQGGE